MASKLAALPASLDKPCATCRGHTVIDRALGAPVDDLDAIVECPDC